MPRPKKRNADYFSHDNDMRNDRKIKAVRSRFGLEGYAVYCMLLEALTDADDLQIKLDQTEKELLAADFGIDTEIFMAILNYMQSLGLIRIENDLLFCPVLSERLKQVFEKREKAKKAYQKQKNKNKRVSETETKVSATENTVSDTEMTQSKVKESKVNNIKEKKRDDISLLKENSERDKTVDLSYEFESKEAEELHQELSSIFVIQNLDRLMNMRVSCNRLVSSDRWNPKVCENVLHKMGTMALATKVKEPWKYFMKTYSEDLNRVKRSSEFKDSAAEEEKRKAREAITGRRSYGI